MGLIISYLVKAPPAFGGIAMKGNYCRYARTIKISAARTARTPRTLNIFCQSTQRGLFSIRLRKNLLKG
jgi:hypothetical protein